MGLRINGDIVLVQARRGPDGVQEFEHKVRKLMGYPDDLQLDFTFSCSAPDSRSGALACLPARLPLLIFAQRLVIL